MAGYVEAAEAYFRSRVERQSLESLAGKYRALDAMAVLLAWDAETATAPAGAQRDGGRRGTRASRRLHRHRLG